MKRKSLMDEPHPLEILTIDIWSCISQFWTSMDINLIRLIAKSINRYFLDLSDKLWRDKLPVPKLITAFRLAIMVSNKDIAEWILNYYSDFNISGKLPHNLTQSILFSKLACSYAAGNGNIDLLFWLRNNVGCQWDDSTCNTAAEGGHIETLIWLRTEHLKSNGSISKYDYSLQRSYTLPHDCPWSLSTVNSAARCKKKNVNMVNWLISEKCPYNENNLFSVSCEMDDIELFKYIVNMIPHRDNSMHIKKLYVYAVKYGALSILNWLFQHGFIDDREDKSSSLSHISLCNMQFNTFRWLRTVYKEPNPINISDHIRYIIERVDELYMDWIFDFFKDQTETIVHKMYMQVAHNKYLYNESRSDVNRLKWLTYLLKNYPPQLYPKFYKDCESQASEISPFILLFQLLYFPLEEYSILMALCSFLQKETIFELKEENFNQIEYYYLTHWKTNNIFEFIKSSFREGSIIPMSKIIECIIDRTSNNHKYKLSLSSEPDLNIFNYFVIFKSKKYK
jgi:hypothetical protein